MIGHSIGEYVAACLAGVFSLADALRLVAARGRLMQALPAGAMLAVPLDEAEVRGALPAEPVDRRRQRARHLRRRPVQPRRSPRCAGELAEREVGSKRAAHLARLPLADDGADPGARSRSWSPRCRGRAPAVPFLSNVTGTWITAAEATDPAYWARHLRETVRFGDCVGDAARRRAPATGCWSRCGPGGSSPAWPGCSCPGAHGAPPLASLPGPAEPGRRPGTPCYAAAGRLWVAGVALDVDAGRRAGRRVPLPTYPFERKRYWVEPDPGARAEVAEPAEPGRCRWTSGSRCRCGASCRRPRNPRRRTAAGPRRGPLPAVRRRPAG